MDRTTLARKLREALFDHIETERRDALQDSAIDSLFEKVLTSCSVLDLDVGRLHSTQRAILGTWIDQQQITCQCPACHHDQVAHASDCAVHNGPAFPAGPCDCVAGRSGKVVSVDDESHSPNVPITPAIGDVNLETMSIYGYKDGAAQWVSINDPLFNEVVASTRS